MQKVRWLKYDKKIKKHYLLVLDSLRFDIIICPEETLYHYHIVNRELVAWQNEPAGATLSSTQMVSSTIHISDLLKL